MNPKFKRIKLFLFDLEGVLFNDGDSPSELVLLLNEYFTDPVFEECKFGIVSARENDSLIERLHKTKNCVVISSTLDKVTAVDKLLRKLDLNYDSVFFMGDELLDLPLLRKCYISAAPSNARREVKRSVNMIFKSSGAENILGELKKIYMKSKEAPSRGTKC
ncbi:MAG: HAD hydrolase family protein [Melioribacteraceae bacterium]|nr:HAD hydrolase family protein [Melioribacteraceae bacterium]